MRANIGRWEQGRLPETDHDAVDREARAWTATRAAAADPCGERMSDEGRDSAREPMAAGGERLTQVVVSRGTAFAAATVVSIAERIVTVGEDILQQVDALTVDLRHRAPGGSFISFAVDVALLPGRGLVAVARSTRRPA